MQRLLDWPPLWLLAALLVTMMLDAVAPWQAFGPVGRWIGAVLVIAGVALMAAAVWKMRAARTTVIPRRDPAALVTGGVFRITRNPIYLGDALVLAGAILWWDVPLAVPLVPIFMMIIQARFIRGEEARLRATFGRAFDDWAARVRRWI